jgi:valyl-tRNA synthetase
MQGYNALWMPGTDHAGIATQTVVEKRLLADEGKRRTELDSDPVVARRKFVALTQAWKDQYEQRILDQLKKIGCSCDWRRTRFTMDPTCARAVRQTFFKLFSDGLIYRGKRLVNWDPVTQTVLADDEVDAVEVNTHFWYLKYPLETPVEIDGQTIESVTVATTRPETMLGDTAVAINPRDPRAERLVGKMVRLPIVGRLIPIIADDYVVLPVASAAGGPSAGNDNSKTPARAPQEDEKAKFSTGFLKVTPAHDPNDYAIGQRHDLPLVNVLAPDGSISDKHGWKDVGVDAQFLLGMDRFEAREAIVEWFRTEGLLAEVRDYTHEVGHSYRSHVPIEPYLSDQWYVAVKKEIANCKLQIADWKKEHAELIEDKDNISYFKGTDVPVTSLAGFALAPLLDGRLKFTPDRYANTYRAWLENLRDWPISRQLWWGHQIPVWTRQMRQDIADALTAEMPQLLAGKPAQFPERLVDKDHLHAGTVLETLAEEYPDKLAARFSSEVNPLGSGADGQSHFEYRHVACLLDDDPEIIRQLEEVGFVRDPDVLDTWFSSALWPFSTLGWPGVSDAAGPLPTGRGSQDAPLIPDWTRLKTFYPTDVLCTAREIITLWVTRMVMMGQYCVGDIPFSDVYIHAMIQDGEGRKMSKSLGNGIDPLDIVDSHGADAMRFTLVSMTTQTQDVRMPVKELTLPDGRKANTSEKFDVGRNFCNKLWNASRFAMMNIAGYPSWQEIHPTENLADAWILSRLNSTIRDVTLALQEFSYNTVASTLYHFMWDDFCDWYLEIAKSRINAGDRAPKAIVAHTLDFLLRLLHPVMPFITEAIWRNLNQVAPNRGRGDLPAEPMLARAQWPHADAAMINTQIEQRFELLQDVIRQIRNVRTQHNVPPGKRLDVMIEASGTVAQALGENTDLLKSQAMLAGVTMVAPGAAQPPSDAAAISVEGARVFVLGIIDRQAERARLQKQAATLNAGIKSIEGKLGNEGFIAKAPPAVVEKERARLDSLQKELTAVENSLASLG